MTPEQEQALSEMPPEMQAVVGGSMLMIQVLKDPNFFKNGGLTNFLEMMPDGVADLLEDNIPPDVLEAMMDKTDMLSSGQSIGGTGHDLFAQLLGPLLDMAAGQVIDVAFKGMQL